MRFYLAWTSFIVPIWSIGVGFWSYSSFFFLNGCSPGSFLLSFSFLVGQNVTGTTQRFSKIKSSLPLVHGSLFFALSAHTNRISRTWCVKLVKWHLLISFVVVLVKGKSWHMQSIVTLFISSYLAWLNLLIVLIWNMLWESLMMLNLMDNVLDCSRYVFITFTSCLIHNISSYHCF